MLTADNQKISYITKTYWQREGGILNLASQKRDYASAGQVAPSEARYAARQRVAKSSELSSSSLFEELEEWEHQQKNLEPNIEAPQP